MRGWLLLPQFSCGGGPANLHVSVSSSNVPLTGQFLADLSQSVEHLRNGGSSVDREKMRREVAALEGKPFEELFLQLALLAGLTGSDLPERMAPLNTLMDMLPAETRDRMLAVYVNAG